MRIVNALLQEDGKKDFNFRVDLIPTKNATSRSGHYMVPTTITIHNTGDKGTAAKLTEYVDSTEGYKSWHFSIDEKEIIQELPINEVSWHAGDGYNGRGNRTSIAIEITEREGSEQNAIKFVAWLLLEMKWGVDRVVPHKHWKSSKYPNGKNCPRLILPHWNDFIAEIKKEMAAIAKARVEEAKAAVQPAVKVYTVKKGDTLSEIAKELYGKASDYPKLMKLNGLKSTLITVGQKLKY